jgi:hypothetical protein
MIARRARITAITLAALLLAATVASCPLGLLAIRLRLVAPPAFAIHIGDLELAAPCPPHMGPQCGSGLHYYAIWRGHPQPDGSTTYQLIYFTYLRNGARR